MNPALSGRLALPRARNPVGKSLEISEKAAPPEAATNVGWTTWKPGLTGRGVAASDSRKLASLEGTYGGTEDGVVWVGACVTLIMAEMGSYPREFINPQQQLVPDPQAPPELVELLNEPNPAMTWFDFMEWRAMDEELAGNSYWLMDQRNALGHPLALFRLRPEYTRIAVNDAGQIIGYVYQPPGFPIGVPYNAADIIHFKRPNPNSEYYGMGTVEMIQRTLESELAQNEYVTGFFSDGAKISGVLTTTTLSEVQFERFKEQFYSEFAYNPNSLGILVAEQGTNFQPVTAVPEASNVVALRRMSKDEILSGFGIPAPLLGGILENSNHKISDSQHILSRRMIPRAVRTGERLSRDLTSMWNLRVRINVSFAEPKTSKVERAGMMLKGGASINESRREMDLMPVAEDWANQPILPQGFAPLGYMTSGGVPVAAPVDGTNPGGTEVPPVEDPDNATGASTTGESRLSIDEGMEYLSAAHQRVLRGVAQYADKPKFGKLSKRELAVDGIWDEGTEVTLAGEVLGEDAANEVLESLSNDLAYVIGEGKRRSYSMRQIVFGFPEEGYPGIAGAFQNAEARVRDISDRQRL